jgi:hypothetical protein
MINREQIERQQAAKLTAHSVDAVLSASAEYHFAQAEYRVAFDALSKASGFDTYKWGCSIPTPEQQRVYTLLNECLMQEPDDGLARKPHLRHGAHEVFPVTVWQKAVGQYRKLTKRLTAALLAFAGGE